MGKILTTAGLILTTLGILVILVEKTKIFPLPGDIVIKKNGIMIFIPITSSILLSILITLILYLIRR